MRTAIVILMVVLTVGAIADGEYMTDYERIEAYRKRHPTAHGVETEVNNQRTYVSFTTPAKLRPKIFSLDFSASPDDIEWLGVETVVDSIMYYPSPPSHTDSTGITWVDAIYLFPYKVERTRNWLKFSVNGTKYRIALEVVE